MGGIAILTLAIVVLGLAVAVFSRLSHTADAPVVQATTTCATCDGRNDKCEQDCMMEAATKPVEYFDDEELDEYKGRPSNAYSDDEADIFRNILYTMLPEEAPAWSRSLSLRGINVPDQLKPELLLMIGG